MEQIHCQGKPERNYSENERSFCTKLGQGRDNKCEPCLRLSQGEHCDPSFLESTHCLGDNFRGCDHKECNCCLEEEREDPVHFFDTLVLAIEPVAIDAREAILGIF